LSENLSREEGLMRKSALHYLGQRITSVANLKRVNARRAQRKLGSQIDATDMIERTIDNCRRNGFVDDAVFVEARIHSGRSKGLSRRRIGAALGAKGIDRFLIAVAFDTDDAKVSEERSAALFAKCKRIGPWRRPERDYDLRGEVAVLARAGYSVDLGRRILTTTPEEAEVLLR
jgi:regulatory protein